MRLTQVLLAPSLYATSLFALAAPALTAPAYAEVTEKSDAGFVSSSSAEVTGKSPLAVWQALIAPQKWWSKAHSWSGDAGNLYLDAQAGGCFCELMPADKTAPEGVRRGSVEHARVIAAVPGKLLRLNGGFGPLQAEAVNGVLSIHLQASKTGTLISWEYVVGGYMRIKADDIAPMVDKVMAEQLAGLAEFAATQGDVSLENGQKLADGPNQAAQGHQ